MELGGRRSVLGSALVLAATVVVCTCVLHWPMPLTLTSCRPIGAFHDGHVWAFDQIYEMVTGRQPWALTTTRIGFPDEAQFRLIAWVPALAAVPLRPLFGPIGCYNVIVLLTPAATGLALWALARRLTGADPWTAAAAGLAYSLCPFLLGSMANGQTAKTSLWSIPLAMLAFDRAVRGPRRWAWAAGLVLATVATCFTAPSLALFLPFAVGLQALWAVAAASGARVRTALFAAAALALTAASMLPSWAYYGAQFDESNRFFAPGALVDPDDLPEYSAPMAMPRELLLGARKRVANPELSNHVTYLGLPLLIAAALASLFRFRGRALAWALVLAGAVIAIGPRLAEDGAYVLRDGAYVGMPAYLLEAVGYPLARGGMYYRAVALASLGLALALAGALGRWRRPWAVALAWVIAAAAVADGVRDTRELWPRRAAVVRGLSSLRQMAADPAPGAVLDLPLATSAFGNEVHLLAAAVHRRSTTAVPRATGIEGNLRLQRIRLQLNDAGHEDSPEEARRFLGSKGYRYVVVRPWVRSSGPRFERLEEVLGPPITGADLLYWRLEDDSS